MTEQPKNPADWSDYAGPVATDANDGTSFRMPTKRELGYMCSCAPDHGDASCPIHGSGPLMSENILTDGGDDPTSAD